ncbi:acyloxyacyl hydrolase [Anditalea andensis]|nr:acyloxyacyl hydrolase [Anditalea andensis]
MGNIYQFILILSLMLYTSLETIGQTYDRFGLEGQYGFIIPHALDLRNISTSNPYGVQLSYSRLNTSKESWKVCNCFYYLGLQVAIHDFGNADILGQSNSLSGFFEPILGTGKSWEFSLKSGIGFTYLTRVYDAETNPENLFFSSPLSFLIFLQPSFNYRISEQLDVNLSFVYNHISNGGQRQPNRGINYPMVGLGVSYVVERTTLPEYETDHTLKKWAPYLDVFGTNRKTGVGDERKYLWGTSAGAYYRFFPISGLGGGLEMYHDQSLSGETVNFKNGFIAAPYASHHFIFGRFMFSQRFAYYLQNPDDYADHAFYQRYILQYGIWQNLQLGIGLKVHGHVAENIDLRLGYTF